MKVALVTDWLTVFGGAEHAVLELHRVWPEAPIFTSVVNRERLGPLSNADIRPSKLQRLFHFVGRHQPLLPLLPGAMESLDLRGYDVIVSSSHAVGKGIIPPSNSVHVCYCHTPMRYAWEMEDSYLKDFHIPSIFYKRIRRMLKKLRRWDLSSSKRVDVFIANSQETQQRILMTYGRESTVVSPPVDNRFFEHELKPMQNRKGFLAVGRLVPYKRFDLLIEVANRLQVPLTIVGRGQEEDRLKRMAGPTVTFHGRITDAELPAIYGSAKALLFPQHEDAGIVPLEAQASGLPVIALGTGGALDSVIDEVTGCLFDAQTVESMSKAIEHFGSMTFDPQALRDHAKRFSSERFHTQVMQVVNEALAKYGR